MNTTNQWPPNYHIRRSQRARKISLLITPKKGLELVLPKRASIKEGLYFLNSRRHWIEKHLARINLQDRSLPTELPLRALNSTWSIQYSHQEQFNKLFLTEENQTLLFKGNIIQPESCLKILNKWIRNQAIQYLPNQLMEVSAQIALPFNRVTIRSQKTLWGSCSKAHDISLNDRLLFLPYELMRYVLIHELCHTRYFSHGKRFWQLMNHYEPNYKILEKELKNVTLYVPSFFC